MAAVESMLHPIGVALDPVLSPIFQFFPDYMTITIMAVFLTALIMVVSRLFVNRKLLSEVKEKMEEIKERLNKAQKSGDKKNQEALLAELMQTNGQYMKQTMKIMAVSIAIFFVFFPWLTYKYAPIGEAGVAINANVASLPFAIPMTDIMTIEWFWWYFLVSFAAGTAMRKIVGSDI